MAYKLVVTQKAEDDLDAILGYLVSELCNAQAAGRLPDEIERKYGLLADNPLLFDECRQPLLKASHFRKVVLGGHLMIYRVDNGSGRVIIERFFSDLEDYIDKL